MYIPRLRKQDRIMDDIKKLDKDTAITQYLIERLCQEGKITRIKYGNAWLINLDEVFDYFRTKDKKKNEKNKHR